MAEHGGPGETNAGNVAAAHTPQVVSAARAPADCVLLAEVAPRFAAEVDLDRLAQVAAAALATEGLAGTTEISLVITDDATIRQLNATYRGVDRVTDVLAFPQILPDEPPSAAPDGIRRLGDIVISFERAQEQAAELGHSVGRELDVLMVHGVLHLLGYTDATPEAKAGMLARGDAILASLAQADD